MVVLCCAYVCVCVVDERLALLYVVSYVVLTCAYVCLYELLTGLFAVLTFPYDVLRLCMCIL